MCWQGLMRALLDRRAVVTTRVLVWAGQWGGALGRGRSSLDAGELEGALPEINVESDDVPIGVPKEDHLGRGWRVGDGKKVGDGEVVAQ